MAEQITLQTYTNICIPKQTHLHPYKYIYRNTCAHTAVHTITLKSLVFEHTHTHMHMHIHTHTHTHTHTNTHTQSGTHKGTHTHTHIYTQRHTHTHTHTHTKAHTHTHTHTYTHTHTHTYSSLHLLLSLSMLWHTPSINDHHDHQTNMITELNKLPWSSQLPPLTQDNFSHIPSEQKYLSTA